MPSFEVVMSYGGYVCNATHALSFLIFRLQPLEILLNVIWHFVKKKIHIICINGIDNKTKLMMIYRVANKFIIFSIFLI